MSASPADPRRAAIYARVSRDEQLKGNSIPTQLGANRAHCDANGYRILAEFSEDFTGTTIHRPEMDKLLALVFDQSIDVVVVYVTDRLTRGGPSHLGWFVTTFADKGVRLEIAGKEPDAAVEGQLFLSLESYAAQEYVLATMEASTRGIKAKVAAGKPIGAGRPPYGLRFRPPVLDAAGQPIKETAKVAFEPDPETLPHLFWMFEAADRGMSLRQMGRALEAANVLPPRYGVAGNTSRVWNPSAIRYMLQNRAYTGEGYAFLRRIKTDGEPVRLADGVYPKLIDPARFERVQERIAGNVREAQRMDRNPEVGLLRRGFARCGHCGGSLMVNPGARGGPAYRCNPKSKHKHGCPGAALLCVTLDREVWQWIEAIGSDPRRAMELAERLRVTDDGAARARAMLDALEKRVTDVNSQRERLVKRLALMDDDTAPLVEAELRNLAAERRGLDSQRPAFLAHVDAADQRRERIDRAVAMCEGTLPLSDDLTWSEKRRILSDLEVIVHLYPSNAPQRWSLTLAFENDRESLRAIANERMVVECQDDSDGEMSFSGNLSSSPRETGATAAR